VIGYHTLGPGPNVYSGELLHQVLDGLHFIKQQKIIHKPLSAGDGDWTSFLAKPASKIDNEARRPNK